MFSENTVCTPIVSLLFGERTKESLENGTVCKVRPERCCLDSVIMNHTRIITVHQQIISNDRIINPCRHLNLTKLTIRVEHDFVIRSDTNKSKYHVELAYELPNAMYFSNRLVCNNLRLKYYNTIKVTIKQTPLWSQKPNKTAGTEAQNYIVASIYCLKIYPFCCPQSIQIMNKTLLFSVYFNL